MWIVINTILLIIQTGSTPYRRYNDYNQYLSQWREIVPEKYIHNVSHFAQKQQCYDKNCQFYYYEYLDQSFYSNKKIVLMVSGMHGNQYLGPHTLLYAYKHLKAYQIIYFPMANPSGFLKKQRETFPNKIDPNRDFPIDGNNNCYQTSATHILDFLLRKYRFDLTVILHNGDTQIGFNWGTTTHKSNSHTQEYNIYHDIAQMMQKVGGESSQLKLLKFPIGTMVETIYAVTGTFDDWAYAASKFPDLISKCIRFNYTEYPKNMANGLVFLIQMGPFQTLQLGNEEGIDLSPVSSNTGNGQIARTIRMLKHMMNVLHPTLVLKFDNDTLHITVQGCKTAQLKQFQLYLQVENKTWLKIFQQIQPLAIEGDLRESEAKQYQTNLKNAVQQGDIIRYSGNLECDSDWQGKGTTSFAQPRKYAIEIIEQAKYEDSTNQQVRSSTQKILSTLSNLQNAYILIAATFLLLLLSTYFMLRRGCRRVKIQKFEQVQYVESETRNSEEQIEGDLHTARGGIISM